MKTFKTLIKENSDKFSPIKSFYLKDTLNPDVWEDGDILKDDIREKLLEISNDFLTDNEIDHDIKDIVLTGSNCNYNWSEYSDYDLHIVLDFKNINEDTDLVSKYFKSICSNWNLLHNVKIGEYDVEIYLQDENEPHISTGQYSLKNNEWLIKPSKIDFKPDENLIKIKSEYIMDVIDAIESNYNSGSTYDEIIGDLKKIWNKIKEGRRSGLSKEGEYSIENLVFKLLRRNGYIGKIIDIRTKSYDEKFNK